MLHRLLRKVNLVEAPRPSVSLHREHVRLFVPFTRFLGLAFVFLTGLQHLYHLRLPGLQPSAYRPLEARAPIVVRGTRAPSRQSRTLGVEVVSWIIFKLSDLRCAAWVWQ